MSNSSWSCDVTGVSVAYSLPYMVIIIVGVSGNSLVCFATYKNKALRTVSNIFVINLAIADLSVLLLNLPVNIWVGLCGGRWFLPQYLCYLSGILGHTFCFASMLTLFTYSIYRYYTIRSGLHRSSNTTLVVKIVAALTWVVALSCSFLPVLGWGKISYNPHIFNCIIDISYDISYTVFLFTLVFGLPLNLMILSYWKMYRFVRDSSSRVEPDSTAQAAQACTKLTLEDLERSRLSHIPKVTVLHAGQPSVSSDTRIDAPPVKACHKEHVAGAKGYTKTRQLIKILVITVMVYLCCWAPYALDTILLVIGFTRPRPGWLVYTEILLGVSNSCCNPFIYAQFNTQYRQTFKRILQNAFTR